MAVEIVVPRLGWSMDEGTFSKWLKSEGDQVNAGDMLFVLEGDKALQEVESFDSGVLRILSDAPKPGDTVTVGQLLGYLVAEGEDIPVTETAATPEPLAAEEPGTVPSTDTRPVATSGSPASSSPSVSPRARRLALELGVDLSTVTGTGRDGRIRESDVRAAAEKKS